MINYAMTYLNVAKGINICKYNNDYINLSGCSYFERKLWVLSGDWLYHNNSECIWSKSAGREQ